MEPSRRLAWSIGLARSHSSFQDGPLRSAWEVARDDKNVKYLRDFFTIRSVVEPTASMVSGNQRHRGEFDKREVVLPALAQPSFGLSQGLAGSRCPANNGQHPRRLPLP